jgi:hypothetical protein
MTMATKPTVDENREVETLAARLHQMNNAAFNVEAKRMLADPQLTENESHVIFGEAEARSGLLAHALIRFAKEHGAHVPVLVEGLDHIESVSDTGG